MMWTSIGLDKQTFKHKIVNIFLSVLTYVLGAQKNRQDGSFEYPQQMLWLRSKKIKILVHPLN